MWAQRTNKMKVNIDMLGAAMGCGIFGKVDNTLVVTIKHSVRATPLNIPKWALCRLYKNSGLGEMRLVG